jgi:hypothetical protein
MSLLFIADERLFRIMVLRCFVWIRFDQSSLQFRQIFHNISLPPEPEPAGKNNFKISEQKNREATHQASGKTPLPNSQPT